MLIFPRFTLACMALAAAVAVASPAPPAMAQGASGDASERRIAVSGVGEATAPPDIARVTVGAYAAADTAREALDQASGAAGAMIDALKTSGIAEADIRTVGLSLSPRWERRRRSDGSSENVQAGFEARNRLLVTCRDLAKLGEMLDAVTRAGANDIGGIDFDIDDRQALEDQARELAVDDARRKAELLAARAGAQLGAIMRIREGVAGPGPMPVMRAEMAMASAPPVPVAAGTQTIRVDVSTVWALE